MPHGSVLSLVLVLIFINDVCINIKSCMRLFVDDCFVYRVIESDEDRRMLQQDLDQLTRWANDWQMCFNVSKCYSMHVTSTCHKPTPHTYTMNSEVLANVKENPYLGLRSAMT